MGLNTGNMSPGNWKTPQTTRIVESTCPKCGGTIRSESFNLTVRCMCGYQTMLTREDVDRQIEEQQKREYDAAQAEAANPSDPRRRTEG